MHFAQLLPLCLIFVATLSRAQTAFQPARTTAHKAEYLAKRIDTRLERDLDGLPRKNNAAYKKIYVERADGLKTSLSEGHFILDTVWNNWFGEILNEIWRGNPTLPKSELVLYPGRLAEPNASCHGEGTLVFNLGLLPFLEDESQVAFVICHEIAHYAQNHVNQAIAQYVETLYGEETQQQLNEISKSEFGKTQKAMALMKQFAYGTGRHSRFKESEADSLAVIYLSRTRYNPAAAIGALDMLDKTDSVAWPVIPYKTLFDAPQFPYQEAWLQQKKNSLSASATVAPKNNWDTDSLKTHPDCRKRIATTARQLENIKTAAQNKFLQSEAVFNDLRKRSTFEVLEGLYQGEAYGRCLYRTLALLQQYPDDAYLNAMVVKCLFQIHAYQKNHELRHVLDLPAPENDPEYDRFLRFMNQFRLKELAQVGYYFSENRLEKFRSNEDFLFASALAAHMNERTDEFQQRRREYLRQYSRGRFALLIKQLN